MKNKNKFLLIFLIIFYFTQKLSFSNEILIDSQEINLFENGNTVVALNGSALSKEDLIQVYADRIEYKKIDNTLKAYNALTILRERNTEIRSNEIFFNKETSVFKASGKIKLINKTKNIEIESDEILYNIKDQTIISNSKTKILLLKDNSIESDFLSYEIDKEILKLKNIKIRDEQDNVTFLDIGFYNLKSNNLLGKDIKIKLDNKNFNEENEPRLKGKSIYKDEDFTIINKSTFTTCKTRNEKCPPWHFTAEKIIHDKKKKVMKYEDFWLNIYDKPILYFPKFFHPDPTVKRQSGFLIPRFQSSSAQGTSFNLPYFHVISDNKDLTFTPRIYAEKKLLIQNEYRQANRESDFIADFSFLNEENSSTNSHIFSKFNKNLSFYNFDETNLEINLQSTNNDTYLKRYKLETPLINSETSLQSGVKINSKREDLKIDIDLRIYEDLNKDKSDRYEYVYPNYRLTKNYDISDNLPADLYLTSSGYSKTTNTNVHERLIINDLILSTNEKIYDKGILNNSSFYLKNINSDSKNSSRLKEKTNTQIFTLFKNDTSFPLLKETTNFSQLLNPKLTFMYSPTNSGNNRDDDKRLSIQNIFNHNRIGNNTSFENGSSFTYGFDYEINDKSGTEIFSSKVANVFRLKKMKNYQKIII